MEEAIVSGFISVILFAWGYGRLTERMRSLEKSYQDVDIEMKQINTIHVILGKIEKDIEHIKQKIDN